MFFRSLFSKTLMNTARLCCKLLDRHGAVIKLLETRASSLFDARDYKRSEHVYTAILFLDPQNEQAFNNVLTIALQSKNLSNAISRLKNRLLDFPDDYFAVSDLVQLSLHMNDLSTAEFYLASAITLAPDSPNTVFLRALLLRHTNDLVASSQLLRDLLGSHPRHFQGKLLLAYNSVSLDQKSEAASLFLEVADDYPLSFQPYLGLASLKYYKDIEHPHLDRIRQLISDQAAPPDDLANLQSAMGQILDSLGIYSEAFEYFRGASAIRKRPFDRSSWSKIIDDHLAVFTRILHNKFHPSSGATTGWNLVFIIGMPRSGTTLVDQILASHPQVVAGGEDPFVAQLVDEVALSRRILKDYPFCVKRWPGDVFHDIADKYGDHIKANTGDNQNVYTNKCLSNVLRVGLLKLIFPDCRFIHCRREPLDTLLSCFFHPLPDVPYSDDLSDLAFAYKQYVRLMHHWDNEFFESILHVDYETMVVNSEATVRTLLRFCGLDWDVNCANFHKNSRVVNTSSEYQVKEPIYQTSVNRWKNYSSHIEEIIHELNCTSRDHE
jgi:tetratricopeptide (TPR) repeat protein